MTTSIIAAAAASSVSALISEGWDGSEKYDLGASLGDLESLEAELGREATRDERLELEAAIREGLRAVFTVSSPDGVVTHTGTDIDAARDAAEALSAKHYIGGQTFVLKNGQQIGHFVREQSGDVVAYGFDD